MCVWCVMCGVVVCAVVCAVLRVCRCAVWCCAVCAVCVCGAGDGHGSGTVSRSGPGFTWWVVLTRSLPFSGRAFPPQHATQHSAHSLKVVEFFSSSLTDNLEADCFNWSPSQSLCQHLRFYCLLVYCLWFLYFEQVVPVL